MPDPRAFRGHTAVLGLCLATTLPAPAPAAATEVYRCVDADGGTVFSEKPCGPDAEMLSIEGHERISGDGTDTPSAIEQLRNYRRNVKDIEELVGHDQAPDASTQTGDKDPCARVTSLQLRNARVGKQVVKCHGMADVRAILGNPDSVSTWSDNKAYDTRWTFRQDDDRQSVYFRQGRVTRLDTRSNR